MSLRYICDGDSDDAIAAFTSSYRCIAGKSRNHRGENFDTAFVPPETIHTSYCRGASGISSGSADGYVYWFLCKKEAAMTRTPNTPRFTDVDLEATIAESGEVVKGTGYDFKDLWENRVRTTLVAMEEGIVQGSWNSGGRVVLMGDSVAKVRKSPRTISKISGLFITRDFILISVVAGYHQRWPRGQHAYRRRMPLCQRARASAQAIACPDDTGAQGRLRHIRGKVSAALCLVR